MSGFHIERCRFLIKFWKEKFTVLYDWDIQYVDDGQHYCMSFYNSAKKQAVIHPCDIESFEDWILHEMLKLAIVAGIQGPEFANSLIEDICAVIPH